MSTNTSGKTRRDWLVFRRSDFIATRIILGIAVAGSVLFGVCGPILDAVNNAPLPMSYSAAAPGAIVLPRGAIRDGNATMQVLVGDATAGERLGQALPGMLLAAITIAIAWLLFQLLRSTEAGEPFTKRNVRRINMIALIVGIAGMLAQVTVAIANNAIHNTGRLPRPNPTVLEMTLTPLPVVAMLVIALFGEVFRRGVLLRDDVEGLV